MKKFIILFTVLSICSKSGRCDKPNDFIKLKEENGIQLSSRWIPAPGNRETRELKAEFEVDAEPSGILELLRNEQQALLWMQGVKEIKMLSDGKVDDWHVYLLYNIPWPLNKQDCIIHYRLAEEFGADQYLLKLDGNPDYMAEKKGIDRISHLSGSWRISKTGEGKCRIEYVVFSFQKPRFPRWASDPIVQSNLIRTMSALRELAEKSR